MIGVGPIEQAINREAELVEECLSILQESLIIGAGTSTSTSTSTSTLPTPHSERASTGLNVNAVSTN